MRHLRNSLLVAAAIAVGAATGANAGSFRFPPEPVMPVPAAIAVPDYSPWYLRGDIAWSFNEDPTLSQSATSFSGEKMDESFSLGGGFGYYFHDNFRGDVTVDHHFEADVKGTNSLTGAVAQIGLASTAVLANLYYDFGDRDSVSPYLGLGLGFSYNDTGSETTTDLAAAVTAGFSYSLHDGFLVDAGYRFLYLGDAETSGPNAVSVDDIYSHELRVGFRYEIN